MECKFRLPECTFHPKEYTFQPLERKISAEKKLFFPYGMYVVTWQGKM
jgi:hypothetical protein